MSDMTSERAIDVIEMMMAEYEETEGIVCDVTMDDEGLEALRFARDTVKAVEKYKDAYHKGYKDGAEAVAFHEELCADEKEPEQC